MTPPEQMTGTELGRALVALERSGPESYADLKRFDALLTEGRRRLGMADGEPASCDEMARRLRGLKAPVRTSPGSGRPARCQRCFQKSRGMREVLGLWQCPRCRGAGEWST